MLQKVRNCKQVKGIATSVNSEPSEGGREQAGNPLFMEVEWEEKVHRKTKEKGGIYEYCQVKCGNR